jgi:N-acetylneuraminic acid mutarotase
VYFCVTLVLLSSRSLLFYSEDFFIMKHALRFLIFCAAVATCTSVAFSQRQTKLYIDDGNGNFTILKVPAGSGGGTITLPSGTGAVSFGGGSLPSGAVVTFPDNGTHAGYTYSGTMQTIGGGTWSAGTAMPISETGAMSATVGTNIYVIGGTGNATAVQIYNTVGNSWSSGTALPTAVNGASCAAVGTNIYVIGGPFPNTHLVQIYNTTTDSWSTGTAPMPTGENNVTAAAVGSNIYVFGDGSSPYNIVQIYNTTLNSWSTGHVMFQGEAFGQTSAVLGTNIYVFGGSTVSGLNQIYSTVGDSWTVGTSGAPAGTTNQSIDTNIYLFGGGTSIYSTTGNSWTTGTAPPSGSAGVSGVVNRKIYVIGSDGTTMQIYSPALEVFYYTVN